MAEPFSLIDMLGRALDPIWVVDVGAMALEGELPPYDPLMTAGVARLVGFEPVKAECDRLNAKASRHERYLPYFIGDGKERTFHLCNYSMTSSLYEPNTPLLNRFQVLEELTRVVERSAVKTTRLDDVPEIERADFLKMDVQGAELDVARGGPRVLQSTLVIQTEVELAPMYKGQPLFADLDSHLRASGFAFHTFLSVSGRMFKPLTHAQGAQLGLRQQLWAEAVYVRDYMRLSELEPAQLLRMAVILHHAYESLDLAALCLQHYDAKTRGGLWKAYMQRLLPQVPEAPPLD